MDDNKKAIQQLLEGVKIMIESIIKKTPRDLTYSAMVKSVYSDNTYDIILNGSEYKKIRALNVTTDIKADDVVKVLIPQNNYNNMFILNGGIGDVTLDYNDVGALSNENPSGIGTFSLNRGMSEEYEIGDYSVATGNLTVANGRCSNATGDRTKAIGLGSHSEGRLTIANGECSHAEGEDSTASGNYSHSEGSSTIASGLYQHVQGKYNIEDTTNTYAHIVGNGTTSSRKNIHTLDWDGNGWYSGDITNGNDISLNGLKTLIDNINEFSGDYNDLTNKPTIPTTTNELVNDSNFVSDPNYTHTDNNYTTVDKDKLATIQEGANVNVQVDWNATNTISDDYIKNKPTIPTTTNELVNDSNFVSDPNYTHTDNNYTTVDKDKLATIQEGANVNVQVDWNATNTISDDYIKNKPTNLSQFTNDSLFITNTVSNLSNYYVKNDIYTKDEVNTLIGNILALSVLVVDTLPTENISTSTIYLVPKEVPEENDVYDEFMYINNQWEHIGSTQVDLSDYYTITQVDNLLLNKVDKVSGKELSTNDFTNTYKSNVDENTIARHTHNNKIVLDTITSDLITTWNTVNNKLDKTGDSSDVTNTFTQSTDMINLSSGEKLSISLGKIMKAISNLMSHILNVENPHNVTKTQVGLGNLDNVRQYSASNPQPNVSGSSGSCIGNSATATQATQDSDGNIIKDTYATKTSLATVATSGDYNDLINKPNPLNVIDNLTSTSATSSLSANQGRVLNETKEDLMIKEQTGTQITISDSFDGTMLLTNAQYNLLENIATSTTVNGVTITVNADKSITVSGTPTADTYFNINSTGWLLAKGTYLFNGNYHARATLYLKQGSTFIWAGVNGTTTTFTLDADTSSIYASLYLRNGVAYDTTFKPMLTNNTINTNPNYVPYGDYSVTACGVNLLENTLTTQTKNGLTFTVNDDKSVTVNGTATAFTSVMINTTPILEAGDYRYSGCANGGSAETYYVRFSGTSKDTDIYNAEGGTITPTKAQTVIVTIRIQSGTTLDNVTFKPQIEKGTTATTYQQYVSTVTTVNKDTNYPVMLQSYLGTTNVTNAYNTDMTVRYAINTNGQELLNGKSKEIYSIIQPTYQPIGGIWYKILESEVITE